MIDGCGSPGLTLWVGRNIPCVLLVMFLARVVPLASWLLIAEGAGAPWAARKG